MNLETLDVGWANVIGVVIGGLAYFVLGALWYTVLLGERWIAATGRTREELGAGEMSIGMVLTLLGAIVATAVIGIAFEWGGGENILDGIVVGAIVGVGVAAMEGLKDAIYKFDDRSHAWRLYSINTSYAVLGLILAGAIYGLIA